MNLKIFLGLRKFSNLSVLHTGLLMQDWVFRLGGRGEGLSVLLLPLVTTALMGALSPG